MLSAAIAKSGVGVATLTETAMLCFISTLKVNSVRCWLGAEDLLIIAAADLPQYKKGGSVVRNNYFWALQSICCHGRRGQDWEFDQPVWVALARLLTFFLNSGYLLTSETLLEFPPDVIIPLSLQSVATWQDPREN